MKNQTWLCLVTLLSVSVAVSCRKEDHQSFTATEEQGNTLPTTYSPPINASSPNLLFEETVEGSTPFSNAHSWEVGDWDYALNFVNGPSFQGSRSARFEIREDQPLVHDGKRSEITIVKGSEGQITPNTWYSFSIFFPSDYAYDNEPEVLNQWYQDGSPSTSLRGLKDRVVFICGDTPDNRKTYDVGPIVKNAWTEYVFHFIHSYNADGLVEIWRQGVKILTLNGGNMYNDVLPKWKIGLYKSAFKYGISDVDHRVVYFDNVRVGNANATFNEMTSGPIKPPPPTDSIPPADTVPPPPASTLISGYTLVNAATDKDVMDITNGMRIDLRGLGISKINIRVNSGSDMVNTVKMVLSGPSSQTRMDDAEPFALFGDDRSGNYYSWSPSAGSYKLTTTVYSGTKSNPGAPLEAATTINFEIVK
jgi:hypothetical protein